MKKHLFLSFLFLVTASAQGAAIDACGAFSNLPKDVSTTWSSSAQKAKLAEALSGSPYVETGKQAGLSLVDFAKVKAISEVKKKSDDKNFGGIAQFKTTSKGVYTVAAQAGVWIEVVDTVTNKAVSSTHHEMQQDCGLFHKAVSFALEADHKYGLQVSGSKTASTNLLVIAAP